MWNNILGQREKPRKGPRKGRWKGPNLQYKKSTPEKNTIVLIFQNDRQTPAGPPEIKKKISGAYASRQRKTKNSKWSRQPQLPPEGLARTV